MMDFFILIVCRNFCHRTESDIFLIQSRDPLVRARSISMIQKESESVQVFMARTRVTDKRFFVPLGFRYVSINFIYMTSIGNAAERVDDRGGYKGNRFIIHLF